AVYNDLGWRAPYGYASAPVLFGTIGGVALLVGPAGLLGLRRRRDPELADSAQTGLDLSFILLLFASSITGLVLLVLGERAAMGPLLLLHLSCVLTLFVTLPYGKFVHGLYRTAALLKSALETDGAARPEPEIVAVTPAPTYGQPVGPEPQLISATARARVPASVDG